MFAYWKLLSFFVYECPSILSSLWRVNLNAFGYTFFYEIVWQKIVSATITLLKLFRFIRLTKRKLCNLLTAGNIKSTETILGFRR